MRRFLCFAGFAAAVAGFAMAATAVAAEAVTVVASIKPVHSLVAGVMQGAGSPHLIVQGGASPHSYSMKPSDAAAMEQAAVVVWVGEGLEAFLESAIDTLATRAAVVELAEVPGLRRLDYREGGSWGAHEDEEADHEEAAHAEAHGHDEHGHDEIDMHLWLDPDNAKAMVAAIAEALMKADPDNSGIYLANSKIMASRLDQLSAEIETDLAPVKEIPFVVFHDGYQYLDTRFDLTNVGSITVNPENQPGAARLREIRTKISELGARCVFSEPQFEPRLVQVVVEGTSAKTAELDPLGADIADGPELYFELLRRNAAALKSCLAEAS
jgi:zinc transport system substrate-binding protein